MQIAGAPPLALLAAGDQIEIAGLPVAEVAKMFSECWRFPCG
jgi:hypothetical protein